MLNLPDKKGLEKCIKYAALAKKEYKEELKRLERAAELFKQAAEIEPKNVQYQDDYKRCYAKVLSVKARIQECDSMIATCKSELVAVDDVVNEIFVDGVSNKTAH
jgi:hypothetical protein